MAKQLTYPGVKSQFQATFKSSKNEHFRIRQWCYTWFPKKSKYLNFYGQFPSMFNTQPTLLPSQPCSYSIIATTSIHTSNLYGHTCNFSKLLCTTADCNLVAVQYNFIFQIQLQTSILHSYGLYYFIHIMLVKLLIDFKQTTTKMYNSNNKGCEFHNLH